MAIYFRPLKPIALSEIKEKCKGFSVQLRSSLPNYDPEENTDKELFYDGKNVLYFEVDSAGFVTDIYQYGLNDSSKIFNELEAVFNVRMADEHQDIYNELGPAFWIKK